MDVTQALRDAENSLRDFIAAELSALMGSEWLDASGVTPDRLTKWQERKVAELKRQEAGVVEERLIYYADFYDLKAILKKHWSGVFAQALGDWKTFEVYLIELEKLRDPDAHRRELLPHQKHLVLGIAGEIRNRILRYRSKKETANDCFPRIESVRDNLGNIWVPKGDIDFKTVFTKMVLRPGDVLEFSVTASDPEGKPLDYGLQVADVPFEIKWQSHATFAVTIQPEHIGRIFSVALFIRSGRPYHADGFHDDKVEFDYQVLPPR